GPGGGHDLVGVGDGQDPPAERDVLAGQALGIAVAVPALVVLADRAGPRPEPGVERLDDVGALLGVAPQRGPLLLVGPVGLVEDLAGDGQLPDVVEEGAPPEPVA